MENIQALINDVRVLIQEAANDADSLLLLNPVQSRIRGRIKEQLARDDLRIGLEMAFVELLHEFEGFDLAAPIERELIIEESKKVLARVESLIETDLAFNSDRVELPDPPPLLAKIVEAELRAEDRRHHEERSRHEAEKRARVPAPISAKRTHPPAPERKKWEPETDHRAQRRRNYPPKPKDASATQASPIAASDIGAPPSPDDDAGRSDRSDLRFQRPESGASQGQGGGSRRRRRRRSH